MHRLESTSIPERKKIETIECSIEDAQAASCLIWSKLEPFKKAREKANATDKLLVELATERIPTLSFFPKNILSSGLNTHQIDAIVNAQTQEEVQELILQFSKEETGRIEKELNAGHIEESISLASQRLEELFVNNGSTKRDRDVRVIHTGGIMRFIMNAKTFDFKVMPSHVAEKGEHFPQHGVTFVYHDQLSTPDLTISTHIHEKVHAYGNNTNVDTEGNKIATNGFATITFDQNRQQSYPLKDCVNLNEGFTEYIARKVCHEIVDYNSLPEGGFYTDEVVLIKSIIERLMIAQEKTKEEVENDLLSIYRNDSGTVEFKQYLAKHGIFDELH